MVQFTSILALALMASPILSSPVSNAASTSPAHGGPLFDPAGVKNVGNGKGLQFIGGQCLSASDCASGCCAGPSGICSGPGAQTQNGKTGCGFDGSGSSSKGANGTTESKMKFTAAGAAGASTAASTSPAHGGPPFDPAGAKNVGNGKGLQFIGGQCLSASDCASGCCAGPSGICSGPGAQTQNGKTGCGFGGGGGSSKGAKKATKSKTNSTATAAADANAAASTSPAHGGPPFDPSGVKNVGNGKGLQFIGGQCLSASDCASGCCAGPSGICSGPGAQTQNGKTGCGFSGDGGATKAKKTKSTPVDAQAAAATVTGKGDTFPSAKPSKSPSMNHNGKGSNSTSSAPIDLNKPKSANVSPTPILLNPKSSATSAQATAPQGASSSAAPHIKLNRRERLKRVSSYVYLNNPVALDEGY